MSTAPSMPWLPPAPADLRERMRALAELPPGAAAEAARFLARHDLDFVRTNALDTHVAAAQRGARVAGEGTEPGSELHPDLREVRLAILGSCTTTHLHGGIRVAGLRRGLRVVVHESGFDQYRQELLDRDSALHRFAPDAVLLVLDAEHLCAGLDPSATEAEAGEALDTVLAELAGLWAVVRDELRAAVIQQAVLPVAIPLMGHNEHRLPGSAASFVDRLNEALRPHADRHGAHLLALDQRVRRDGMAAWHDPVMWHRARQEVFLPATPFYGELVARLLAALCGRSAKVLVLDLDDTVWGGVAGDDGVENLVLGAGSAAGEGFLAVQRYADALSRRGVVLAVCSKNDPAVAEGAFDRHPEMVLKRDRIASFVANWDDKATNLRRIAAELDVGLDALVLLDDNPFERDLVRRALPAVFVPEVPADPALVPGRLFDAGYFESVRLTAEDRERVGQYRANRDRRELAGTATDLPGYLQALGMRLRPAVLGELELPRAVQLINKTNQFNLCGRRRSEPELRALLLDPGTLALTFRLLDRFGDSGLIGVAIAVPDGDGLRIDTWLMSCRVLGRGVEDAMLAVIAARARGRGAAHLVGEYVPSGRNAMVAGLYPRLGFVGDGNGSDGGMPFRGRLDLSRPVEAAGFVFIEEF